MYIAFQEALAIKPDLFTLGDSGTDGQKPVGDFIHRWQKDGAVSPHKHIPIPHLTLTNYWLGCMGQGTSINTVVARPTVEKPAGHGWGRVVGGLSLWQQVSVSYLAIPSTFIDSYLFFGYQRECAGRRDCSI